MKMLYVFLSIFLSACGHRPPYVDPELQPYVDMFKIEAEKYNVDVSEEIENLDVVFVNNLKFMGEQTVGLCSYEDGWNKISILKNYWMKSNWATKEDLFLHEAGHCVLNLEHVTTPSIMHANILGQWYYMNHRDSLVKELFTGSR